MDTKRLILFLIFSFSILMLWDGWQRENAPQVTPEPQHNSDIPAETRATPSTVRVLSADAFTLPAGQKVHVKTDMVYAIIDTQGGDLRHLELIHHKATEDKNKNFILFDDQALSHLYIAQSGLIGNGFPNHKASFTTERTDYILEPGNDKVDIRLQWSNEAGLQVDKVYTFHRGSYVIDLRYELHNASSQPLDASAYFQIVHDSVSNKGSAMMPTFSGAAYYTETDKYKKLKFDDMKKSNLSKNASDGWIGMVQHYFASAWILRSGTPREFYTKDLGNNLYSAGEVTSLGGLTPGASVQVTARLFAGPQEQKHLKEVAPGLEYTVDYGWLTVIATPLFWILTKIQSLVHNWGVAIILLTVMLKLVFFPLSAASYKSMAHMRKVAPRLQQLKERYGDDREKLHKAMMELYKTEKINPMGGCLPILVQIPVFISLYWVLLGSVEMRHAPFFLWIQDLSATDPYYVLPVLMGLTMIIQSSLNPPPPDPVQAKVMKIMPVAFSVFFFFFPAGLVLYWLVNNILSIAQQWAINRSIEGAAKGAKA
jgi:YidC/Oxa1 family membrane protein insertase